MHAKLHAHITIGGKSIGRVNNVIIKRSAMAIIDTCNIKLPTQVMLKANGVITKGLTAKEINEGDEVVIKLWYNDRQRDIEFHGFVKYKNYSQPVEIECEDFCYLLRKVNVKKTYKNSTIQEIIKDLLSEIEPTKSGITLKLHPESDNIDIINFVAATKIGDAITGLQLIQLIKDKYGLAIYFNNNGELYIGLMYKQNLGDITYKMGLNVIRRECNLNFRKKEDIKLKIKAVHIDSSGNRTEVSVGDGGGLERTVILYDVADKTKLQEIAKNSLDKYKYDGYQGTIKTFLEPQCFPANTAVLSDSKYPDRDGDYYIEEVTTEFGVKGARRTIQIGPKISLK